MITKEDVKKLRGFINTSKRVNGGMKMPKNIEAIVDEMCEIYETKYQI